MNMSDKRIRILMVLGGLVIAAIVAGVLGLRGGSATHDTASSVAATVHSTKEAQSTTQAPKPAPGNGATPAA
ncbi:hypothetical protein FHY52_08985, partial [Nocardia nova]|nr:hypothetical protein [Nocardia nova]